MPEVREGTGSGHGGLFDHDLASEDLAEELYLGEGGGNLDFQGL